MRTTSLLLLSLGACAGPEPIIVGHPLLGAGSHDVTALTIEIIADSASGLATPTDLDVNPNNPDQLWVTNMATNSVTRLDGDDYSSSWTSGSFGQTHFLVKPSGLAFSDNGRFATIHDEDEPTQGNATPADFMGPTLWDDSPKFDGGHGGHLDMLHNSPMAGGIAWDTGQAYWTFDGAHSSITRYDFKLDHGYGGSNHNDGVVARWVEGEVSRTKGIPSGLAMDHANSELLIADTANGRIATMDTTVGSRGSRVGPNYDGTDQYAVAGGSVNELVSGTLTPVLTEDGEPSVSPVDLVSPSGIAIHEGLIWLTDNATSTVIVLDESGELLDWVKLDAEPGSLAGMTFTPDGALVLVDMKAQQVLRITETVIEDE
ncbi:MAG: hypothetical protein ACI9MC_000124 [Kiritimatiellia bacterium]